MTKLSRYVSFNVLMAMLLVQVLLLGLDLVFSFIGELDNVRGNFRAWDAFIYTVFVVPGHAYQILPISALVGALVGLGALASSSELTIIRAAGISTLRIVWWVMRGALIIVLFGLVLGEYVVPHTDQRAEATKAIALGQDYQPGRVAGYWQREGDELLNIRLVTPEGKLLGVSRYQYDENGQIKVASHAATADFSDAPEATGWQLNNVRVTEFMDSGESRVSQHDQLLWPVGLTPEFLRTAAASPEQLRLGALLSFANYLESQGQDAGAYVLQFWKKVLSPLAIFSMVLIACSFIFGPLRSVTLGFRIIIGVLVGLVFRYTQEAFGFASLLFQWPPLLAVLFPIVLCMVIGVYALYRVR